MTTPERLKRRQHLLGFFIAVMGLALVGQALYFNREDHLQRACLANQFALLTESLNSRSALVDKETNANRGLWEVFAEAAGLVKDDPTKPLSKADQDRLNAKLVHRLLDYQQTEKWIVEERQKHPIAPYPEGKCD